MRLQFELGIRICCGSVRITTIGVAVGAITCVGAIGVAELDATVIALHADAMTNKQTQRATPKLGFTF